MVVFYASVKSLGGVFKNGRNNDLLFALANLARWAEIDPEAALRKANEKFRERFAVIEVEAHKRGKPLSNMTLEELDEIWEQAKQKR